MSYCTGAKKLPYPWQSTSAGFTGVAAECVQVVYAFVELMVGMMEGKVSGFDKIQYNDKRIRAVKEAADGVFNSIWVMHGIGILHSRGSNNAGQLLPFHVPKHSRAGFPPSQLTQFIREKAENARLAMEMYRVAIVSIIGDGQELTAGILVPLSHTAVICHAALAAKNSINLLEYLVTTATEEFLLSSESKVSSWEDGQERDKQQEPPATPTIFSPSPEDSLASITDRPPAGVSSSDSAETLSQSNRKVEAESQEKSQQPNSQKAMALIPPFKSRNGLCYNFQAMGFAQQGLWKIPRMNTHAWV